MKNKEIKMNELVIKKDNFDSTMWPTYRKARLTRAIKMNSPFIVQTREGELRCENGYLAVDSEGYPYPIDIKEFENIYVEVK